MATCGDGAEQVGGLGCGGSEQSAESALLALVGKEGRDAEQGDEHPGDELAGGGVGLRIVFDSLPRWRPRPRRHRSGARLI